MSAATRLYPTAGGRTLGGEAAKVAAFLRRDLLVAWSYRLAFFGDLASVLVQAFVFSLVGKLVDPRTMPVYGNNPATYLEFAAIGIVLSLVVMLLLKRVADAMRHEQMIGTLETLLCTPTAIATIQIGSAAFEFLYVPIRAALMLVLVAVLFGLDLHASGILPASVLFVAFVPFLWGLGLMAAGSMLTFRRGASAGAGAALLGLVSGAFFPVGLLPDWIGWITVVNPVAIALEGIREVLLGGVGWAPVAPALAILAPLSALSLAVGVVAFRLALRRERRLGTLGLY